MFNRNTNDNLKKFSKEKIDNEYNKYNIIVILVSKFLNNNQYSKLVYIINTNRNLGIYISIIISDNKYIN
jgi:hypothetical protein